MELFNHYVMPFLYLLAEMAPYLLLGFLVAGVLHAFVPQTLYHRYLGGNNLRSVFLAIVFGVPLPLCSCGVIPTAVGMRKEGASKGATTAFLIATPQTGIDSILATWSVFGLPFAIMRPIVAMVTGFVGGTAANMLEKKENEGEEFSTVAKVRQNTSASFLKKCRIALDYGFTDMLMDIGQWLVVGIVLAGLITIFVPEGFFLSYQHSGVLNMFIVLLIACPMYVCATGSIPIAAALMLKGLSPGAALVFLMAGPATNMASIMVLGKTLGRRSLGAYLVSIVVGAIAFGLAVDMFLPASWFNTVMNHSLHSSCCHEETLPWWQTVSTIVFLCLLVRALYLRYSGHTCGCGDDHCHDSHCDCGDSRCDFHDDHCEDGHGVEQVVELKVTGMMCNHCRAHVEEALSAVEGTTSVSVDLGSGIARITGASSPSDLIAAVEACGYGCEQKGIKCALERR